MFHTYKRFVFSCPDARVNKLPSRSWQASFVASFEFLTMILCQQGCFAFSSFFIKSRQTRISIIYRVSFVPQSAGYLCWFSGLYAWSNYQPEKTLYFVQVIIQWILSENKILAEAGRCIRNEASLQAIRQLALPLANALLAVLRDARLNPVAHKCALDHLDICAGIYHQLGKDFIFELVESVTSWKHDFEVTSHGISSIINILQAVLVDDQAAFLATRYLLRWERDNFFGESSSFTHKQKLLDLLEQIM